MVIYLVVGCSLAIYLWQEFSEGFSEESSYVASSEKEQMKDAFFLPKGGEGIVYQKKSYYLSYVESHEQPEWVAYTLTRDQLKQQKNPRPDRFQSDRDISSGSAVDDDYRNSGYSRGHLVPAADRSYDMESLRETFRFSNICPQEIPFNGGVWRELEECTRDWAKKFRELYIVSGAIYENSAKEIGRNKVNVPSAFYKVILDNADPERKAIAFLIPHAVQDAELKDFALSVDELENRTNLDFFGELLEEKVEIALESKCTIAQWPVSHKRYQQRIKHWNKR